MKTSDLTGHALDWAVAKCEGVELMPLKYSGSTLKFDINGQACWEYWNPSTDWSQGGPIIDRERIELIWFQPKAEWHAYYWNDEGLRPGGTGPTRLIACLRCYVASKLGDEVEIPEELK